MRKAFWDSTLTVAIGVIAVSAAAACVGCWRGDCFVSLKSDPDDDQGCERVALALIFYLYGLPGLEIRQIAGLVSDPNDGLVGDFEPPGLVPAHIESRVTASGYTPALSTNSNTIADE